MLENEFRISLLIAASLRGHLTKAQQEELQHWLEASVRNRSGFESLSNEEKLGDKLKTYHTADHELIWNATKDKIRTIKPNKRYIFRIQVTRWRFLGAAASVILMVSIGLFFFLNNSIRNNREITALTYNTIPGRHAATLTLSDGKRIVLSDYEGKQQIEDGGVVISKTADSQLVYKINESKTAGSNGMNALSTANGETYQVILPDGSKVWLNAASVLKYPTSFVSNGQRKVELIGEAYFEVSKDKKRPFIVSSKGQEIEVLGTHFNVNSYLNEPVIKTILLEGSVKIHTTNNSSKILIPGQQATVSENNIAVGEGDVEEALAWKNGEFLFRNGDLKTTMRQIERWYDVEVFIDPSVPADFVPGGFISRSKDLLSVLRLIELTKDVHFKVEGRRVSITK